METSDDNDDIEMKAEELPFGTKMKTMTILNAIFRYGQDIPYNIIPGVKEFHSKIDSSLKQMKNAVENKPTLVDWLKSDLFEENEYNIPLALLFIAWYEQNSSLDEKDTSFDFRELYHFLYKITTNQPIPNLTCNAADVLNKLISEIIEEVWPNIQPELLDYLSKIHTYSRSTVRRTYSRKS
ncbi:hypothetical protein PUN28_004183 [Cardiocondyla obscurior]|uniref:Uncharacterized protein n=1 Tax=Cardiocondyla obscurior TaxID=286306 RepID=A0AAW2GPX4_9HYME